jgi:DNA-binding transcriptional LysR family regulator
MEHLADIAIFVKVVDLGSFTAAATALETSQPAVSKSVTRLEQRLDVRLLNRTTRRLSFTEAGAELYRQGTRDCRARQRAAGNRAISNGAARHPANFMIASYGPEPDWDRGLSLS